MPGSEFQVEGVIMVACHNRNSDLQRALWVFLRDLGFSFPETAVGLTRALHSVLPMTNSDSDEAGESEDETADEGIDDDL